MISRRPRFAATQGQRLTSFAATTGNAKHHQLGFFPEDGG
jgi:hypothetical protein